MIRDYKRFQQRPNNCTTFWLKSKHFSKKIFIFSPKQIVLVNFCHTYFEQILYPSHLLQIKAVQDSVITTTPIFRTIKS